MRLLADGEDGEHFGVHIAYADLFMSMVFLACIYMGGVVRAAKEKGSINLCHRPNAERSISQSLL